MRSTCGYPNCGLPVIGEGDAWYHRTPDRLVAVMTEPALHRATPSGKPERIAFVRRKGHLEPPPMPDLITVDEAKRILGDLLDV